MKIRERERDRIELGERTSIIDTKGVWGGKERENTRPPIYIYVLQHLRPHLDCCVVVDDVNHQFCSASQMAKALVDLGYHYCVQGYKRGYAHPLLTQILDTVCTRLLCIDDNSVHIFAHNHRQGHVVSLQGGV